MQQHSRQNQNDTLSGLVGPQEKGLTVIASSEKARSSSTVFPFDQCTNPSLYETEQSRYDGVEDVIEATKELWKFNSLRRKNTQAYSFTVENEVDGSSELSKRISIDGSKISSKSILTKTQGGLHDQLILKSIIEIFMSILKRKAQIKPEDDVNLMISQAVNFATNLFIQEFQSANSHELCLDILAAKKSGILRELLQPVLEDVIEQHRVLAFDRYQDAIVDSIVGDSAGGQPTENPEFHQLFIDIWSLSPGAFFSYDLEDVLCFCSRRCKDKTPSSEEEDKLLLKYEETAVTMNVVSSFHALRREYEYLPQEITGLTPKDFKQLEGLLEGAANYHLRTHRTTDSRLSKLKTKTLRFVGV